MTQPISLHTSSIVEIGRHWTVACNANQNLLGKTMLVLTRPCTAVTDVDAHEWSDLHDEVRRVCRALDTLFAPDHYNHCFLMNVDAQVHLHVIPRYASPRVWDGEPFVDEHWGAVFGTEQRRFDDDRLARLAIAVRDSLPARSA